MFEFRFKHNELNSLSSIDKEIEALVDDDCVTDESSIFDSVPTSQTFSVINEDIIDKDDSIRPISCYATPPLPSESVVYNGCNKKGKSDLLRKSSWLGRPMETSIRRQEYICMRVNDTTHSQKEDIDYSSLNNEARRKAFCQCVCDEFGENDEQSITTGDKEILKLTPDNSEDTSFASSSNSFEAEDISNISTSTIHTNKRIPKSIKMRSEFNPAAVRNRLSFLKPVNPIMKIKIFLSQKNQDEDVMALRVQKDKLQDINELLDIIISKITNSRSDLDKDNIKLLLFFKQEKIRPIPLVRRSNETSNESALNLSDNTSLIMDYLSGREKLYIRALF